MKIRCVQCGREFELSQNEIDFYYSKGLDLPKRCKSCRDKNSGKYIVTYSEKHSVNLFFFAIFLALAVAVAYFDFAAHTFTGVWPIIIISASALISIIFLCCVKTYKFYDVSFSNKYKFNFYDAENLINHFYKHKDDVGCHDVESYLKKANSVILDKKSIHKTIANGDTVYYNKKTEDYVVLARAGYIRSYYKASYNHYLKQ